ncbi:MAG: branched-chain amino acid ABC transporter substrate-binding protein [Proteobacteria bacterium]|nr:branched-chain amino acid ABC transporter substrate-binding protein [Pseudomonadota bacterium]MBU1231561.1 branched-chain amino acid ABC transporter substrate-binding protein [Pseudomonadota bacterium]MBU1419041.1 branched-chain amino acid ABC transporter substrate-binding protein [Pseudomonadota bacterium]MBU1456870.1 branched-chain amino acid ABC transporter substrate-binding protein [Pseudomonadota bacterium]
MPRNNTTCLSIFSLVLFLAIFLSACSESEPPFECSDILGCINVPPGEPVKIGVLQAVTGEVAPLGQAQIRGLELALDKRNRKILAHPVALQVEDTGCRAEGGANAALKIIADPQTAAIFGTTCSGAAATASKAMSDAGLTMISGNNSAPFLTAIAGNPGPSWQEGFFRTAPNEENAGKAAAGYAYEQLGLRRAATINDNDIYTKGLTESFKKSFVELGGRIVLDTAINKGDSEMDPVLTAVVNSRAELLFFPLFQPEANYILLQARKIPALDKILLISGGALIEKTFLEAVGEAAKGMCFVGPTQPSGPAAEQLTRAYTAKYKEEPTVSYFLSAYDAADLLFHAIEQAAVRDHDGTLHIGRKKLRDTLYAVRRFKGSTGTLSCDQFGDCAMSSFQVLRLDDPALGLNGLEANVVFPVESKKSSLLR